MIHGHQRRRQAHLQDVAQAEQTPLWHHPGQDEQLVAPAGAEDGADHQNLQGAQSDEDDVGRREPKRGAGQGAA